MEGKDRPVLEIGRLSVVVNVSSVKPVFLAGGVLTAFTED